MKFFQNMAGLAGGNLNPMQLMLRDELLPAFKELKQQGFSVKEAGFALANHFERTNTAIEAAKCLELLRDPNSLILAYRKAKGKANRPVANQYAVLTSTFKATKEQELAINLLGEHLVIDALPSIVFKQCLQYLAQHQLNLDGAPLSQWTQHQV
jgi:hypothetical protein